MLGLGCIILWVPAEAAAGPGRSGLFLPSASVDQPPNLLLSDGGPLIFPNTLWTGIRTSFLLALQRIRIS